MPERFISEAISPVAETADTSRMAIGEPGLPRKFVWRGRTITVTAVLHSWRETGKCRHGSPEMYVCKHWYEVLTASDGTMKLYFERQARGAGEGRDGGCLASESQVKAHQRALEGLIYFYDLSHLQFICRFAAGAVHKLV